MSGEISAPFPWTCPYCGRATTINNDNFSKYPHGASKGNIEGEKVLFTYLITCPNPDCKRLTVMAQLHSGTWSSGARSYVSLGFEKEWMLMPSSRAKVFPDYVPQAIRDDYSEACEIVEKSPKAAATLSRRALQGMIRDFWKIRKDNLKDAIDAIKDKVDMGTWDAIDAVRRVGNIGAHMEQDVSLIIDVEPDEASLLIGLVESLIQDWYIARHDREERLQKIKEMSAAKETLRKGHP